MNCEVEKILLKFKKVDNCVIASIVIKERFYYKKTMTLKIRH